MQIIKVLWTLPNTLIGLMLGFLSFAWPRWDERGALVFESERGFRRLHSKQGYRAITFGHAVLTNPNPNERLMRHELAHVEQYERWGPFYVLAYGFYWLKLSLEGKDGYYDNPFEVEASQAEIPDSAAAASEARDADLASRSTGG